MQINRVQQNSNPNFRAFNVLVRESTLTYNLGGDSKKAKEIIKDCYRLKDEFQVACEKGNWDVTMKDNRYFPLGAVWLSISRKSPMASTGGAVPNDRPFYEYAKDKIEHMLKYNS